MKYNLKLTQLLAFLSIVIFFYSCKKTTEPEITPAVEVVNSANFVSLSDNIYLHGTISFQATDTTGGLRYNWSFGDDLVELSGWEITHQYDIPGIHTVKLEIDGLTSSRNIKVYPGNLSYQIKNESSKKLDILSYIDNWNNGSLYRFDLSSGSTTDSLYASTSTYGNILHGFNVSIFANNIEYALSGFDSKFDWIKDNHHSVRIITDSTKCHYRIQDGSNINTFFYLKDIVK